MLHPGYLALFQLLVAVGGAIVGLSTSNEIGNRLEAMNDVLDQGTAIFFRCCRPQRVHRAWWDHFCIS
jgi:hypothetical protein